MCRVSIIIPVYNTSEYIDKCLLSVINQSYSDFEIIIVNDGSTDDSEQKIVSLIQKFPNLNIKYIYQNNKGVSAARNLGLKSSIGEYILFIDSDDFVEENLLEENIPIMEKNNSDIHVFGFKLKNEKSKKVIIKKPKENYIFLTNEELKKNFETISNQVDMNSLWNKIYRKSFITHKENEFVHKKIGEDAIFNYKLYKKVNIISFNSKCFYNYVSERNGSAMNSNYEDRIQEKLEVIEEKKNLYKFWSLNFNVIDNYWINIIYREIMIIKRQEATVSNKIFKLKKLYEKKVVKNILKNINFSNLISSKMKFKYLIVKVNLWGISLIPKGINLDEK